MDPNLQNAVSSIGLADQTIENQKATMVAMRNELNVARNDLQSATNTINSLQSQLITASAQLSSLQAEYDAYKAAHPATTPPPDPEPPTPVPDDPTGGVRLGAAYKAGESLPSAVETIDFFRFFFDPNDMEQPQNWATSGKCGKLRDAYSKYGCRVFSISFKPGGPNNTVTATAQANIKKFLQSIPSDVKREDVLVTFYHEHDGNIHDGSLTIAQYRAGSKIVADIAHGLGMQYGPIHNGNVHNAAGKSGLFPEVWKANEADVSLYDFWGTDCYSPSYQDPSPRMDPITVYADSLRLPVLIGEMASPYDNADAQAKWAVKARAWALDNVHWASWWSSQVSSSTPNYRLRDQSAKNWFGLK